MTETRHISEEYTAIGQRLVDTDDTLAHIRESDVQIIYLASNKPKKSKGKLALSLLLCCFDALVRLVGA